MEQHQENLREYVIDLRLPLLDRIVLFCKRLRLVLEMKRLGYRFDWRSGYFRFRRRLFSYPDSPEIWIEDVYSVMDFELRSGKSSGNSLIQQWVLRKDISFLPEGVVRFEGSDVLERCLERLDCPPLFSRELTPLMRDRLVRLESHEIQDILYNEFSEEYDTPYYAEINGLKMVFTRKWTLRQIR